MKAQFRGRLPCRNTQKTPFFEHKIVVCFPRVMVFPLTIIFLSYSLLVFSFQNIFEHMSNLAKK